MLLVNSGEILLQGDQLNIWFILNEDDRYRFVAEVDRINQYNAFTLGIYKYEVVSLKRGVNPDIPSEELRNAIASNNIVMRLFNDENDNHIFAFETIDLTLGIESWWRSVHNFILNTAHQNRILIERTIAKKREEKKKGNESKIAEEEDILAILDKTVAKAKEEIEVFIAENLKKRASSLDSAEDIQEESAPHHISRGNRRLNKAVTNLVETIDDKEQLVKELLKLFAKTSSNNAHNGETLPTISVERVTTKKYGKVRSRYGIVVTNGTQRTSITFSSVDQTMIYITAMLRYKLGSPLHLYELYEQLNNRGYILKHQCPALRVWLLKVYDTIIDKDGKNASRWINKISDTKGFGHSLYQAKSGANRVIRKALGETFVAECCMLSTMLDSRNYSYYAFDCPPENISVDSTLQTLLDEFPAIPMFI